jgi:hypothetical protein
LLRDSEILGARSSLSALQRAIELAAQSGHDASATTSVLDGRSAGQDTIQRRPHTFRHIEFWIVIALTSGPQRRRTAADITLPTPRAAFLVI